MNIYKLSVKVPNKNRYDVYDSAIVIAKDEEEARSIHPASNEDLYWDEVYDLETDSMTTHKNIYVDWGNLDDDFRYLGAKSCWTDDINNIEVEYIGTAKPNSQVGVVLSSFNAG